MSSVGQRAVQTQPRVIAFLRVAHGSVPRNALVAEPMYLAGYLERIGTGTRDMIRRCVGAGIAEPKFAVTDGFVTTVRRKVHWATGEVIPEVIPGVTPEVRLVLALTGSVTRRELQNALGLHDDEHFRTAYLVPTLEAGLIEITKMLCHAEGIIGTSAMGPGNPNTEAWAERALPSRRIR